jgi:hypothetical protein
VSIHPYIRSQMADMRIDQLIAEADRARLGREARGPRGFRLAALRLAARGLRVEREIEFKTSQLPERAS